MKIKALLFIVLAGVLYWVWIQTMSSHNKTTKPILGNSSSDVFNQISKKSIKKQIQDKIDKSSNPKNPEQNNTRDENKASISSSYLQLMQDYEWVLLCESLSSQTYDLYSKSSSDIYPDRNFLANGSMAKPAQKEVWGDFLDDCDDFTNIYPNGNVLAQITELLLKNKAETAQEKSYQQTFKQISAYNDLKNEVFFHTQQQNKDEIQRFKEKIAVLNTQNDFALDNGLTDEEIDQIEQKLTEYNQQLMQLIKENEP